MFRYQGSKVRLYKQIEPFLEAGFDGDLIVPFVGSGYDVLRFLRTHRPNFLWLNDIDPSITSIWKAVHSYPLKFISKIKKYQPRHSDFFLFKQALAGITDPPTDKEDITDIALMKIAIHELSHDGKGELSSGPGVRTWNKNKLVKLVDESHDLLRDSLVRVTTLDFEQVLNDERSAAFTYIDPPDINQKYKYDFTMEDHWRLSEKLYSRKRWLLLYDNDDMIRSFYGFAKQIYRSKKDLLIEG